MHLPLLVLTLLLQQVAAQTTLPTPPKQRPIDTSGGYPKTIGHWLPADRANERTPLKPDDTDYKKDRDALIQSILEDWKNGGPLLRDMRIPGYKTQLDANDVINQVTTDYLGQLKDDNAFLRELYGYYCETDSRGRYSDTRKAIENDVLMRPSAPAILADMVGWGPTDQFRGSIYQWLSDHPWYRGKDEILDAAITSFRTTKFAYDERHLPGEDMVKQGMIAMGWPEQRGVMKAVEGTTHYVEVYPPPAGHDYQRDFVTARRKAMSLPNVFALRHFAEFISRVGAPGDEGLFDEIQAAGLPAQEVNSARQRFQRNQKEHFNSTPPPGTIQYVPPAGTQKPYVRRTLSASSERPAPDATFQIEYSILPVTAFTTLLLASAAGFWWRMKRMNRI